MEIRNIPVRDLTCGAHLQAAIDALELAHGCLLSVQFSQLARNIENAEVDWSNQRSLLDFRQ